MAVPSNRRCWDHIRHRSLSPNCVRDLQMAGPLLDYPAVSHPPHLRFLVREEDP
jgi:hypothetical protein